MRSIRQQNARDKLSKKVLQSSLSALPSTNSRNKKHQKRRRNPRKTSTLNSLHKPQARPAKLKCDEEKDYDSEDSLDQLLNNNFIPRRSNRPNTNQPQSTRHKTPRKHIRSAAGGKRAKALALMASTKAHDKRVSNKKKYKQACAELNARKVITPAHTTPSHPTQYTPYVPCTPKQVSALRYVATPCTPTPVKLMRSLNVLTPCTEIKTKPKPPHVHDKTTPLKVANTPVVPTTSNRNKSWKDIEYDVVTPSTKAKTHVSEYNRLRSVTRPLPLPIKWRILFDKFNALESTLALYMRKNSFFVHYQNIEHSVQQITKKKFDKKDIQRMLSVVPDFFHIQWTATNNATSGKKELKLTLTAMDCDPFAENANDDSKKKGKNDKLRHIGIRFLKIAKLKERENVFRLRLIQYVAHHHKQYLTENAMIEFDPFETGKWHKRFDLENVKDIEISPLPLKPTKDEDEIAKMIKEQQRKLNEIVQNEIEKAKENDNEKAKEVDIPSNLRGLSPTFIAKIRAKKKNKIVTTKRLKSKQEIERDERQFRLQQLPYLVSLVRGIYVSMRKSSMSCNDLVSLIKKRHRNIHLMGAEIWKQLQLLDSLDSKFFKIRQGPVIKVAKLNKKVATKHVLHEIKTKTN
eukprot:183733_1